MLGVVDLRALLVVRLQSRELSTTVEYLHTFVFGLLLRFIINVEEEARWVGVSLVIPELALILVVVEVLEGVSVFDLFSEDLFFFNGGTIKVQVGRCVAVEHAVVVLF